MSHRPHAFNIHDKMVHGLRLANRATSIESFIMATSYANLLASTIHIVALGWSCKCSHRRAECMHGTGLLELGHKTDAAGIDSVRMRAGRALGLSRA